MGRVFATCGHEVTRVVEYLVYWHDTATDYENGIVPALSYGTLCGECVKWYPICKRPEECLSSPCDERERNPNRRGWFLSHDGGGPR